MDTRLRKLVVFLRNWELEKGTPLFGEKLGDLSIQCMLIAHM